MPTNAQTTEIRPLSDTELDAVNGGSPLLGIMIAAVAGFDLAAIGALDAIDFAALARQLQ